MKTRAVVVGLVTIGTVAFVATSLARVPPHKTVDGLAIVDLDALSTKDVRLTPYRPERLHWTVARGLGLAYHVEGEPSWAALPLAKTGPGEDLPQFVLQKAEVRPVAPNRIGPPREETIWLSGGGKLVSGVAIAPDALLRFFAEDDHKRLGISRPLADCLRKGAL